MMGWKRTEEPALEARRTREERRRANRPLMRRSWWVVSYARRRIRWNFHTCQKKGRFLRLKRANTIIRIFHRPIVPEKPSRSRSGFHLRLGAIVQMMDYDTFNLVSITSKSPRECIPPYDFIECLALHAKCTKHWDYCIFLCRGIASSRRDAVTQFG